MEAELPSEIRRMKKEKFTKKRSLGQNFLVNRGILKIIIEAAKIKPNEVILEIGPGKGMLTRALLNAGAKVIAVEKDNRLIPVLKKTFENELKSSQLTIIHGDILTLDFKEVLIPKNYKVVANIPYYITGSLIRLLLSSENQPKTIILMLQKEVAKRIVASDNKESLLSLSVKAYGVPRYIKTVSRGSFSPAPSVDSAILSIENISKDFFNDFSEKSFFETIRAGFSSKRKKLVNNLEKIYTKNDVAVAFKQSPLSDNARAENLTFDEWHTLLSKLKNPQ